MRVRRAVVVVPVLVIALGSGCSASSTGSSGASTTTVTSVATGADGSRVTVTTRPVGTPPGTTPAGARRRLDGFEEVTVTVTRPDGSTKQWCLLLADSEPLRQQGLMFVTDPALGGYDGMLFAFDRDTTDGFWMKNTILPLSLAYVKADGVVLKTLDMDPCPADAPQCPTYPSGGSYRYAVEVPQGGLSRLGIDGQARLEVGTGSCPAA